MWNKLAKTNYYISFHKHKTYEIIVTNFVNIWAADISIQKFLVCAKSSNNSLKIDDDILLEKVETMMENPMEIKKSLVSLEGNDMNIEIMTITTHGYPIKLKIKLLKGSEVLFFQKVTSSLFNIVKDLNSSQNELFERIKKKDREIEDYKLEGAKLGLKYLKTQWFNADEHIKTHNTFHNVFPCGEVPDIKEEYCTNDNGTSNNLKQETLSEAIIKHEDVKQELENQSTEAHVTHSTIAISQERNIKRESAIPRKKMRSFLNL